MCLIISNKIGYIAEENIVCYKILIKGADGKFITPCQSWPVELGTTLIPDEKEPDISEYGVVKWCINGGAIHACLDSENDDGEYIFKAIIPKGTRYWIGDNLKEIASEKLELTDELVNEASVKFDYSIFLDYGADVKLKDGSRVKIRDKFRREEVEGIFAYDNQCIGLEFTQLKFSDKPLNLNNYPSDSMINLSDLSEAKDHMGGKELSDILEKTCSDSNLLALNYCRKNKGYLPSARELTRVFENLGAINITLKLLNLSIIPRAWFWSSSVDSDAVCDVFGDGFCSSCIYYDRHAYVLPFLSSYEK